MKKIAKKYLLPALVKMNAEQLYHLAASRKILNVFYHGVVNTDSTHIFPRHLVKGQFEQHIKYLGRKFNVISIPEAFEYYRQGIQPDRKTVTVSFDDGYLNNLETALPILEKYKIKTTFFISGICSEDDSYIMWSDIVSFARHFSPGDEVMIGGQKFTKRGRYDLANAQNVSVWDYIKQLSYTERDRVLQQLVTDYGLREKIKTLPREFWKLMNREQIRQMSESEIVTIASHGHLHYNLANISEQAAETEMRVSKEILSGITQQEIDLISFPDGSYNDSVKKTALALGYKGLLAVDYRCASDLQDTSILNRWGVSSTTSFETIAFLLNRAFIKHAF